MAYNVTTLVRKARLPVSMGKRRLAAKAVLLALADRCNDRGGNAWPSKATIAAECELDSVRTVNACLRELAKNQIIFEQEKSRQHRPRTWAIDLAVLASLAPMPFISTAPEAQAESPLAVPGGHGRTSLAVQIQPEAQAVHPLTTSGVQGVHPLTADEPAAWQNNAPEVQAVRQGCKLDGPEVQAVHSESTYRAPDPVRTGTSLNSPIEHRQTREKKNDGNIKAAREILRPLVRLGLVEPLLLQQGKAGCLALSVDLGSDPDEVLYRALLLEKTRALVSRTA